MNTMISQLVSILCGGALAVGLLSPLELHADMLPDGLDFWSGGVSGDCSTSYSYYAETGYWTHTYDGQGNYYGSNWTNNGTVLITEVVSKPCPGEGDQGSGGGGGGSGSEGGGGGGQSHDGSFDEKEIYLMACQTLGEGVVSMAQCKACFAQDISPQACVDQHSAPEEPELLPNAVTLLHMECLDIVASWPNSDPSVCDALLDAGGTVLMSEYFWALGYVVVTQRPDGTIVVTVIANTDFTDNPSFTIEVLPVDISTPHRERWMIHAQTQTLDGEPLYLSGNSWHGTFDGALHAVTAYWIPEIGWFVHGTCFDGVMITDVEPSPQDLQSMCG